VPHPRRDLLVSTEETVEEFDIPAAIPRKSDGHGPTKMKPAVGERSPGSHPATVTGWAHECAAGAVAALSCHPRNSSSFGGMVWRGRVVGIACHQDHDILRSTNPEFGWTFGCKPCRERLLLTPERFAASERANIPAGS